MAMIDDIATYLQAQSTLFTIGSDLGKQAMLDSDSISNTFTSLYETAGVGGAEAFSGVADQAERVFDRPGLQVLCRSTSYATAASRAQTAYGLLDGMGMRTLPTSTGTVYLSVDAVQAPFSLGRDLNDRWIVATNYLMQRARTVRYGSYFANYTAGFMENAHA